jgi:hypothetical protein
MAALLGLRDRGAAFFANLLLAFVAFFAATLLAGLLEAAFLAARFEDLLLFDFGLRAGDGDLRREVDLAALRGDLDLRLLLLPAFFAAFFATLLLLFFVAFLPTRNVPFFLREDFRLPVLRPRFNANFTCSATTFLYLLTARYFDMMYRVMALMLEPFFIPRALIAAATITLYLVGLAMVVSCGR